MKISINSVYKDQAWGGSNQFVKSFFKYLTLQGHHVVSHLNEPGIDIILIVHPAKYPGMRYYGIEEALLYKKKYPKTILVHRVNVSDEGKNSSYENDALSIANSNVDYTIFISSFLKDIFLQNGFDINRPHSIILNAADHKIFNSYNSNTWNCEEKMKIVTHHWSSNLFKGYDIYERLDLLLETSPYKDLYEFTIIGNIPKGIHFRNTTIIKPMSGISLASEIKKHNIYLTAARNEGAGMHQIEGMCCGLPVLYLNSGALPEYCSGYGVEFTLINFEKKLLDIRDKYNELRSKVLNYNFSDENMIEQYDKVFSLLIEKNNEIIFDDVTAFSFIRNYLKLRFGKLFSNNNIFRKIFKILPQIKRNK